MYRNVIVFDGETGRQMDYSISPNENRFNGFVDNNSGKRFLVEDREDSSYKAVREIPVYKFSTYVRTNNKVKPSIYKRSFPTYRRDEYKYQFTNTIRKTVEEIHDVYYNERRNRYLDKIRTNNLFTDSYIF